MFDGARTRKAALAAAKRLPWMGRSGRGMARPCELEPGLWIELHQGSHGILVRTKMLLESCDYPLSHALVEYETIPRGEEISREVRKEDWASRPAKPPNPNNGERPGAYAKRVFTKAFLENLVPEEDFFACLDNKAGTKKLLGLCPGGHPLFSRTLIKDGRNSRFWVDAIPTHFGFPVFVNSQWRDGNIVRLNGLFSRWGVMVDSLSRLRNPKELRRKVQSYSIRPVQTTLFGLDPKRPSFSPSNGKISKHARSMPEKIGAYAKRTLYAALAEGRVPDDDFRQLKTYNGTLSLLGISLSRCPLFSTKPIITSSGIHSWAAPAQRNGCSVFVCMEWYEHHRSKLNTLLGRWKSQPVSDSFESKTLVSKRDKQTMLGKKDLPTQIEEFYDGIFSSDDFWEYAAEIYGLNTTPAAKAAQIRCLVQRFIRLDREHWISVHNFKRVSDWDMAKESSVASVLSTTLGNAPFLPVASMSESVLSSLPTLCLDGKPLSWTRELVASVAALLVPVVHVANHGVVPQTLTALLVQTHVPDEAVLDMALAVYCNQTTNNRSVEGAFAFLRDNYIRSRLTDNLKTEIRKYLSSHVGQDEISPSSFGVSSVEQPVIPDNSDENEKLLDDWANGVL